MLFFACHSSTGRLERAMAAAGENRAELQKVIDHYSSNPADSLKLRAALFLIENMPGHACANEEKLADFYDSVNTWLDLRFSKKHPKNRDSIVNYTQSLEYSKDMLSYDIHVIKADFLIHNIEYSFSAWESPWAQHLTFDQFCEYLLPYKYAELQRLDYWKDSMYQKFHRTLGELIVNDENYHYAYTIGYALNEKFKDTLKPVIILRENKLGGIVSPFFNSRSLPRISFGDCNDYAVANVAMMRSLGVPATLEYIPQWGEKASGQHGWPAIYNNSGFMAIPHTDKELGTPFFPTRKLPKVFRFQYAPVPEREAYMNETKYIHKGFAQFEKDVTSEYVRTSDVTVPIRTEGLQDKYVYIAVSNLRDWSVVDYGVVKSKKAMFKNMGTDIVYRVMGYDGKGLIPVSEPFLLCNTGELRFFSPDTTRFDSMKLWRKYPKSENTVNMERRLLGGRIQASNDSLFVTDTTLYEIADLYFPDLIPINNETPYRYWRYLGIPGSYANIAELQFYKNGVDSVLTGKGYAPASSTIERAFDGDWLTYFNSRNKSAPAWIALDFGEPITIDRVRCVPRSDDNGIHFGDTYELNYHENGVWNPIRQKIADERFIVFDSVPSNALLLLKNLTRGSNERIFSWENGKQVWR